MRAKLDRALDASQGTVPVWTFPEVDGYLSIHSSLPVPVSALVFNGESAGMNPEAKIEPYLSHLRTLLPELRGRYGVDTLEVFGSRVRADVGRESDLDLLVTFTVTPDLLTFIALENELSERLGVPVDLVMRRALKRRLRERILREAIPV